MKVPWGFESAPGRTKQLVPKAVGVWREYYQLTVRLQEPGAFSNSQCWVGNVFDHVVHVYDIERSVMVQLVFDATNPNAKVAPTCYGDADRVEVYPFNVPA
jgi:hypothetical protein